MCQILHEKQEEVKWEIFSMNGQPNNTVGYKGRRIKGQGGNPTPHPHILARIEAKHSPSESFRLIFDPILFKFLDLPTALVR